MTLNATLPFSVNISKFKIMPLHKFKCKKCGEEISRIVMHEDRMLECEQCGGMAERILTAPVFRIDRKLQWKTS
jgi:putative FmdB family regulatory protein